MFSPRNLRPIRSCIICNNKRFVNWAGASYKHYINLRPELAVKQDPVLKSKYLANYQFKIKKCTKCSFVFSNPQLAPKALAKTYTQNSAYFSHYQDPTDLKVQALINSHKLEMDRLKKLINKGNILDVGCGGGYVLKQLTGPYKKTGVDIDPIALKFAHKLLGKKVKLINNYFLKIKFPPESFNAVIIRGTIEHVSNPRQILQEIYRVLKPGGYVYINTPNIDSICAKLYKQNFRLLDPIHHIWYFSPQTLNQLLKQIGLKIKVIKYNYFNTQYFHPQDIFQITLDWILSKITNSPPTRISPPFYGNFMDVYAQKPK